jgi:hypothetical protein
MLEKDIENLIAKYPDEFFPSSGFKLIGQQVRLGKCFADIIFEDKYNRKVIIEVKRGILSRDASGQVMEYYGLLKNEEPESIVELILCANIIPAERKTFLETIGIECKELGINRLNEIASKYNYKYLDSKESRVLEKEIKLSSLSDTNRVWIFQANPNRYDILNALADDGIGIEKHWLVNQHKNEISAGDIGLIWLSGREGGIYAVSQITSNPEMLVPSEKEEKYWIDSDDKNKERLRVKMELKMNLLNNPITKEDLRKTAGLESLSIFRQSQGTNFRVTENEWKIIKNKLDSVSAINAQT